MRLIDADEFRDFIYNKYAMSAYSSQMDRFLHELHNAPTIEPKTKAIAQITFDEDKLREIVHEAVERFKEECDIADNPDATTIEQCDDAISREWIKDYCKKQIDHYEMRKKRILSEKAISYDPKKQIEGFEEEITIYKWISREVAKVPSVAPSRPKGMDELVEGFAKALTYEDVITAEAEARGYAQGFKDGMENKSNVEWTPWKDGLPDCDVEVLVTDGTFVWIDELQSDGDMYWWDCQNVEPETTAWMYLPEPYKESE